MTKTEWLNKFNKYLSERMHDIDDDVFMQVSIVERYLSSFGVLPSTPEQLDRVKEALEVYSIAVLEIGEFPGE
jgi:hypothetical protein